MNNFYALSYLNALELNPVEVCPEQDLQDQKNFRYSIFPVNALPKPETPPDIKEDVQESKHFLAPFLKTGQDNVPRTIKETNQEKRRPFSCDLCGKTFLLKHHLTNHSRTHTGIKPHRCDQCGKCFTQKHCLNTHLLLHSSDRPYQCRECKKNFTLKHHLITHMRVSTFYCLQSTFLIVQLLLGAHQREAICMCRLRSKLPLEKAFNNAQ